MESIFIILGILLTIAGITGCLFPVIPGPPLNFMALLLLQGSFNPNPFSSNFIIIFGILNFIVLILDYTLPMIGAKIFGASKYAIWGSIVGMLIGLIFFPPFGMIIGIFLGAVIGEIYIGKKAEQALKIGLVTFISNILLLILKFSLSFISAFYFFKILFFN